MHLGGLMLQSYSKLLEIFIKIASRWTLSSFLVLDASIEDLHNPAGPLFILWHVFWVKDTISSRDLVYLLRCCLLQWLYRCLSNNRGRRTGGEVPSWGFLRQVPSYLGWFALVREVSAGNPSSVLCILFMQSMNGFLEHFCELKFHHLQNWRSFEVECARIVDNEFVHMGAGISEVHGNDSCLWNWRQDLLCCCCKKPSHLLLYEMIIRWSLMSRFENCLNRFKGCASWKLRFLESNYTRTCCNYLCLNSL